MATTATYTTGATVFQEFLYLLGQMVQTDLMRQIDYLKTENRILRSKCPARITTTAQEKHQLLKHGLPLKDKIKNIINIVGYSTFRRWASDGITAKGKIKDRRGRPRLTSQDLNDVVIRMAKENPGWGYLRILKELKKLFSYVPSKNTIKAILIKNGIPPVPERNEDSWDVYLKRTFETLWACDFFSRTIWTALGPKTFFVLFFINIRTRRVHVAGIAKHPNKEWIAKTAKTLDFLKSNSPGKKLLIRDRDMKFTKEFDELIRLFGIEVKMLPYKSPYLNPYAESWVNIIKRECLDYFAIFGQHHFEYLVREYAKYYNDYRPHPGLDYKPPSEEDGEVKCKSMLGGLAKHYYRI